MEKLRSAPMRKQNILQPGKLTFREGDASCKEHSKAPVADDADQFHRKTLPKHDGLVQELARGHLTRLAITSFSFSVVYHSVVFHFQKTRAPYWHFDVLTVRCAPGCTARERWAGRLRISLKTSPSLIFMERWSTPITPTSFKADMARLTVSRDSPR